MGGWGRDIVGKFLSEEKRNERFCLRAGTFNRSREPKKRCIVLPDSSMSIASGEGSLWETAVAILMLRHCIEAINDELSRNKKTRSTQRTWRPRDLLGNNQEERTLKNMWVWAREGSGTTGRSSSEVALRTPPNDNEAPPEKRRNEGGDVFSGGCARRALRPALPGEART